MVMLFLVKFLLFVSFPVYFVKHLRVFEHFYTVLLKLFLGIFIFEINFMLLSAFCIADIMANSSDHFVVFKMNSRLIEYLGFEFYPQFVKWNFDF
jgi:hypothetical protein